MVEASLCPFLSRFQDQDLADVTGVTRTETEIEGAKTRGKEPLQTTKDIKAMVSVKGEAEAIHFPCLYLYHFQDQDLADVTGVTRTETEIEGAKTRGKEPLQTTKDIKAMVSVNQRENTQDLYPYQYLYPSRIHPNGSRKHIRSRNPTVEGLGKNAEVLDLFRSRYPFLYPGTKRTRNSRKNTMKDRSTQAGGLPQSLIENVPSRSRSQSPYLTPV